MKSTIITATIIIANLATHALSQTQDSFENTTPEIRAKRLSGPRMGMSYAIPDGKELQQTMKENNMGSFISQFGWHFEWLVEPKSGGPAFVIEGIPFIGGVEYGLVIPSLSLVMGVRLPSGYEFGMGPMAYFTGKERDPVGSSLVLGVGKSLDFNGVSIPLNLAVATSNTGTRLSFVFGYALNRD